MRETLLDTSAPFVRAVLASGEDGAGIDAAVEALVAAENRHGVRIFHEETVGSLAQVWVPVRTPRPTLRELRALMARHPCAHGRSIDPATWDAEIAAFERLRAPLYRDGDDDDTPDAPLFAFLSETSLLLGGTDFANDHWIEFPGGAIGSWTQRAWGKCLAQWTRTPAARRAPLDSITCTYYLYTLDPDYETWCARALAAIRRKCAQQFDV
ncbi:hypothetical protein SAMN02745121_04840 [Nannocystis exedens]|uniref:Uncharacterized protein n=1 Tax=Nannocystis exedens TaxID=54 RepID=A0A1I2BY25_9BACT|nr:hypothetical protein [Nannocystis exedens]PCC71196.1 hypothetical protein NAEX_04270 [Nannocystis exedens]SFE60788.1 hypothetical protein SAMN02745121_04840 [Nannocystis exedens]